MLFLVFFGRSLGRYWHVTQWHRTGRDYHGRFIPKGDPREAFSLGIGMSYTEKQIRNGFVEIGGGLAKGFVSLSTAASPPITGIGSCWQA